MSFAPRAVAAGGDDTVTDFEDADTVDLFTGLSVRTGLGTTV